jgi:hypothetical protein
MQLILLAVDEPVPGGKIASTNAEAVKVSPPVPTPTGRSLGPDGRTDHPVTCERWWRVLWPDRCPTVSRCPTRAIQTRDIRDAWWIRFSANPIAPVWRTNSPAQSSADETRRTNCQPVWGRERAGGYPKQFRRFQKKSVNFKYPTMLHMYAILLLCCVMSP